MSSINLQGKGESLSFYRCCIDRGINFKSLAMDSIQEATTFAFTQGDLTKPESPRALVEACQKKFGDKIDILLNVAGIMDSFASVETVTTGGVHKSGAIVNVSSKAGMSGAASGLAYTTSKHGLIGATKSTAWLLKSQGIRCNAICPGAVATNISAGVDQSKFDMQSLAALGPVHALQANMQTGEGVLSPETVANVLLFLASDLSKDINGAVLPVDSGWSVV
ncbi:oxidoreductase ucpA [Mycena olivaceomarginata]|nr:oxidoreductase ucpA [Mycena olivaceomarginata]